MIERHADRAPKITVGTDKAHDTQDFVKDVRAMNATPHVAQNDGRRRSAIDGRVTRHAGYALSQTIRKRIEEVFGWGKQVGRMRRTLFRGLPRGGLSFAFTAAAYNLVRLPKLIAA